jgi:hypothetical protein
MRFLPHKRKKELHNVYCVPNITNVIKKDEVGAACGMHGKIEILV